MSFEQSSMRFCYMIFPHKDPQEGKQAYTIVFFFLGPSNQLLLSSSSSFPRVFSLFRFLSSSSGTGMVPKIFFPLSLLFPRLISPSCLFSKQSLGPMKKSRRRRRRRRRKRRVHCVSVPLLRGLWGLFMDGQSVFWLTR